MKKFFPGQRVLHRGRAGVVAYVGRTPGMVDVQYPDGLMKRHRAQDLRQGARRNPEKSRSELRDELAEANAKFKAAQALFRKAEAERFKGKTASKERKENEKKYREAMQARTAAHHKVNILTSQLSLGRKTGRVSKKATPGTRPSEGITKTTTGGSFKRPDLVGGRQAAQSPIDALLARQGAGFFALPDPPRFVESRTGPHYVKDLCGNPIDGTLYGLAVSESGRFIKRRVTQKVWDTALQSWERRNRTYNAATSGPPDPEDVLQPLMRQGGWNKLIQIGRRPGASPYPGAERTQLPFSADEVSRIKREGTGTPFAQASANFVAYSTLIAFADNQDKFTGKDPGPYFQMLVDQMKKMGAMPRDGGEEAREIGRQTYLNMQESRLFTGSSFQRKLKQMEFFLNASLGDRVPSFNAVGRGESIARDRSKDGKVAKTVTRALRSELKRAERAEKAVVAETGQYEARGRRGSAKSKQADIQVEQPTRNSAFVQVPGESGYFMLNLARNESDALRRLFSEAQPPWDDLSGKNTSPFFAWKRLDRPFDIQKSNFSSPPICVTAEHREILKAARDAKKPLAALVGTMKGLQHALSRGSDPHEVYKKEWGERAGTKTLRILAWVASWSQDMIRTTQKIPKRHRALNPALIIFDTIAKGKGRKGGLDLAGLIRLGTAEPIPLISQSGRGTASVLYMMEMQREDLDFTKKEKEAMFEKQERKYAPRQFEGKSGIVGQTEKGLQDYVGYGMDPAEALAHLTVTRMVAVGALAPKDMVTEQRRLTYKAQPLFSARGGDEPTRPVLHALFVIYHSLGGDRTLLRVNAAQRKLTYAISDGGRLPDDRASALLRKLRSAEEVRDHGEDAEQRAVAEVQIAEIERELRSRALGSRMSVLGQRVSVFYTFNPTLFLLTKSTWNRTGGAWIGNEEQIRRRLERVDAVGQYGYALKLFYDGSLGKETLSEVQESLIDEVGIDAFREEFDYRVKLKKAGREDPTDPLTAEGTAWDIRREFPHLGLLSPGEGGVHSISRRGEDGTPSGWYADSWRGHEYGQEIESFIDDPRTYLEGRRRVAVSGMLDEKAELDHERRSRRERRARKPRSERASRTPRWEIGETEQVDITFGDDLNPLPVMGGPPYKVTPLLRQEEESSWYPPSSGVAALEHLDRDARTLQHLIQQRLQELKPRS